MGTLYSLVFYVPKTYLNEVKEALFLAGAGKLGNYEKCSWETPGQGQFRPVRGSRPFLGELGQLEQVAEFKVEMICRGEVLPQVIKALKKVHPYEEPAYSYWPVNEPLKKILLNNHR